MKIRESEFPEKYTIKFFSGSIGGGEAEEISKTEGFGVELYFTREIVERLTAATPYLPILVRNGMGEPLWYRFRINKFLLLSCVAEVFLSRLDMCFKNKNVIKCIYKL